MLSSWPGEQVPVSVATNAQLFALYRTTLAELRRRGVVRTENAPAGDYAEYLVASAFGGVLAPNSEKSWDLRTPDGTRVQVKARVVSAPPQRSQRQLSPFRSFEFDTATIVLLAAEDYSVWRAVSVPVEVVRAHTRFVAHVNGHVLHATGDVLDHPNAIDVTDELRRVETRPLE